MHLLFFILMVMSVFLYKERLFADASYYLFQTINKGWFHIEHGRTVLGISQLLPLVAYYLHLPLKLIMVLASLGHELFYYAVFLFCLYPLKDKAGALAVLAIHVIGQLWLYYSPMLEICYGAALAIAFYSILKSGRYHDQKWLILLLLIQWFALMSHPENFLLIAVAIIYDFIERGFQKRIHLVTSIVTALAFIVEILTFSEYEKGHTEIVGQGKEASALNLFNGEYFSSLIELFTHYYWDALLLMMIGFILLLKNASWKKTVLYFGSILFLTLIVNQASMANEYDRYHESMYSPLVFLAVFFFVYELKCIPRHTIKISMVYLLLIIAGMRIAWTYHFGEDLRLRSAQLERIVDEAQELGGSKYIIAKKNFEKQYSYVSWANPIESLLYSAIDGKEKTVSIITDADYEFERNSKISNPQNFILRRFDVEPLEFLNPRYFQLKEERYSKLNTRNWKKEWNEYTGNIDLSIDMLNVKKYYTAGDSVYLPVKIINRNQEKLPSSFDGGFRFSYHLLQRGEMLQWDGVRTPLEADITGEYTQYIKVKLPEQAGYYELQADLLVEGKGWLNKNASVILELR